MNEESHNDRPAGPTDAGAPHPYAVVVDSFSAALDELVAIDAQIAGLHARRARILGSCGSAAAARASARRDGRRDLEYRELAAEIGAMLRTPEATVHRMLDESETLCSSLPRTLDALAAGTISYRHAQAMVANAVTLPPDARAAFESTALHAAREQTSAQFAQRARVLRERMHPESTEARRTVAVGERCVILEPARDGMASLYCVLPAPEALAIDDALDQIARSLRGSERSCAAADVDGGSASVPAPRSHARSAAPAAADVRTHAQRRADVFVDLLLGREGATAKAGRGITPTVIVSVPVLSLLGHTDEPAELHGYGPIDPATARRLAARAPSFIRILTHPETGETLSVGRERYRPPADLRLALALDDQTCRFPGCRRAARRCELDHTVDWAHGGHTSRANLAHLCPKHHHLKHETRWSVEPGPHRSLTWTSPHGRQHVSRPVGRADAGPPLLPPALIPAPRSLPPALPRFQPLRT
jgi:hypothetical protein